MDTNLNLQNQRLQMVKQETEEDKTTFTFVVTTTSVQPTLSGQPVQTQDIKWLSIKAPEGTYNLPHKNCFIHKQAYWLLLIGGIESQERMIKHECHECVFFFFYFFCYHWSEMQVATQEQLVQVSVSTQLNKLCSVLNQGLSLFLSLRPHSLLSVFVTALCVAAHLYPFLSVSVSL